MIDSKHSKIEYFFFAQCHIKGVLGQTTYEGLVDRFNTKAIASDPATKIDWKEKLLPLFTLQVPANVLEESLQSQNISHISTPVHKVFNVVEQETVVIIAVANLNGILRNQHDINKLNEEIRSLLANDSIASKKIIADYEFKKKENIALSKAHIKLVEKSLNIMKTQYDDFSKKVLTELNQVKTGKELFAKATTSLVDQFTNVENPNSHVSSLGDTIARYREAQSLVWDHLKIVKELLVKEYTKRRNIWAEFLLAVRLALDTNPQQLKPDDRKAQSLPAGSSSGLVKKKMKSLAKVFRRSKS